MGGSGGSPAAGGGARARVSPPVGAPAGSDKGDDDAVDLTKDID